MAEQKPDVSSSPKRGTTSAHQRAPLIEDSDWRLVKRKVESTLFDLIIKNNAVLSQAGLLTENEDVQWNVSRYRKAKASTINHAAQSALAGSDLTSVKIIGVEEDESKVITNLLLEFRRKAGIKEVSLVDVIAEANRSSCLADKLTDTESYIAAAANFVPPNMSKTAVEGVRVLLELAKAGDVRPIAELIARTKAETTQQHAVCPPAAPGSAELAALKKVARRNPWKGRKSELSAVEFIRTNFEPWLTDRGLALETIADLAPTYKKLPSCYFAATSLDPSKKIPGLYVRPRKPKAQALSAAPL